MPTTTVILGAGASADFGMPLGAMMYDEFVSRLTQMREDWVRFREDPFADYRRCVSWMQAEPFRKALLQYAVSEDPSGRKDFNLSYLFGMIDRLERSPVLSIDTFALENEEFAAPCKSAVAEMLIHKLKEHISRDEHGNACLDLLTRLIPDPRNRDETQRNWVHLFLAMARTALAQDKTTKFEIISFNYDKIFEQIARDIWSVPSRHLGEFDEIFSVTYPHGQVGWSIDAGGHSTFSVEGSAIEFAHIHPGRETLPNFGEKLETSDKIIALGFAFAPENIRTLGIGEGAQLRELIYQNYDNNRGLDARARSLNVANLRSFSGSIADAILQGELGELPA